MSGFELLCIGDLHLGRRCGRLPAPYRHLGPEVAWERCVDEALRRKVHAVLLAGDVIDHRNRFRETFGPMEQGIARLHEAGILCCSVAGNHDAEVLPRLAEALPGFRVLGQGGRWESMTLDGGAHRVRVVGWSDPGQRLCAEEALLAFDAGRRHADETVIGLMHAECAEPPAAMTLRSDVDAWLLGHIHKPTEGILESARPTGFLGSVVGLDPTEAGWRGSYLLRIEGPRQLALQKLAVSPLRWETVKVEVGATAVGADIFGQAARAMERRHRELDAELAGVQLVAARLEITGRVERRRDVADYLETGELLELSNSWDGVRWVTHDVLDCTRPGFDLERLAGGRDPIGLLARDLLTLREPNHEKAASLLADAREHLTARDASGPWTAAGLSEPSDSEVIGWLEQAGLEAIEAMLEQRVGGSA